MIRFLPFAILILMTAACSREKTIVAAAGGLPATSTGQVETVAASRIVDTYRASGTVRARYTAAIAAKIAANILDIRVQAGDRATAGQTLITLDHGNPEANLRRAEAACIEAESAIAEAENAIAGSKANFDLARV